MAALMGIPPAPFCSVVYYFLLADPAASVRLEPTETLLLEGSGRSAPFGRDTGRRGYQNRPLRQMAVQRRA